MLTYSIVAGSIVVLIALVTLGREARRLDSIAPRVVYHVDQATLYVAENLPADTQSRITFGELQQLLVVHLNWLRTRDLLPRDVTDRRQRSGEQVVVSDDVLIALLMSHAEKMSETEFEDVDFVNIVNLHLSYMSVIGAVGPEGVPG